MARAKHERLTFLRSFELLENVEFSEPADTNLRWRFDRMRDALREHMRAELARLTARRRRRR